MAELEVNGDQMHSIIKAHSHRVPDAAIQELLVAIRQKTADLDLFIQKRIPNSRERSLAITKLEECRMWLCNAATLPAPIPHPIVPSVKE